MVNDLEAEEEGFPTALGAEEPSRWVSESNPGQDQRLPGLTLKVARNVFIGHLSYSKVTKRPRKRLHIPLRPEQVIYLVFDRGRKRRRRVFKIIFKI